MDVAAALILAQQPVDAADPAERWLAFANATPVLWSLVLLLGFGAGLVLLLYGQQLARVSLALLGVLLGAATLVIVGTVIGALEEEGAAAPLLWVVGLAAGGAVVGGLLGLLLYRVWIGIVAAASSGLLLPLALIAATAGTGGAPGDGRSPGGEVLDGESDRSLVLNVADGSAEAAPVGLERPDTAPGAGWPFVRPKIAPVPYAAGDPAADASAAGTTPGVAEVGGGIVGPVRRFLGSTAAWLRAEREAAQAWWEAQAPPARTRVWLGSLVGVVIGLVGGLLLPRLAASLETAAVGACLLYLCLAATVRWTAPEARVLPSAPPATLLTLGLITAMGVCLQWTLLKRAPDEA